MSPLSTWRKSKELMVIMKLMLLLDLKPLGAQASCLTTYHVNPLKGQCSPRE